MDFKRCKGAKGRHNATFYVQSGWNIGDTTTRFRKKLKLKLSINKLLEKLYTHFIQFATIPE